MSETLIPETEPGRHVAESSQATPRGLLTPADAATMQRLFANYRRLCRWECWTLVVTDDAASSGIIMENERGGLSLDVVRRPADGFYVALHDDGDAMAEAETLADLLSGLGFEKF